MPQDASTGGAGFRANIKWTGFELQITEWRNLSMFRKMRRAKQQLTQEECIQILKAEPRGILSVLGDDGYPYGMPLDHWYCEEDGCLYFHGAKEGHKIDAIRRCSKVSYCVFDQGYRNDGEWALNIKSVIVFGEIHPLTDSDKAMAICRNLCLKFTDDPEYIEHEIQYSGPNVLVLCLRPEHISGKLVNES